MPMMTLAKRCEDRALKQVPGLYLYFAFYDKQDMCYQKECCQRRCLSGQSPDRIRLGYPVERCWHTRRRIRIEKLPLTSWTQK